MSTLQDGLDLMNKASKAINKKGFFSSKPEYDVGAQYYEQAALIFKNLKVHDQAIEAYVQASKAHVGTNSYYLAAKALDHAAQLANPQQAADCFQQASQYYLLHNSAERAADALEKAAKSLEPIDIEKSTELYIEACDVFEKEEKPRMGVDTFQRAIAFFIRNQKLDNAILVSQRLSDLFLKIENRHGHAKQALSTIILCLALGDEVDAAKRMDTFASVPGFMSTDQGAMAGELIETFEARDGAKFESLVKSTTVSFLDNQVARLALSIKLASGPAEEEDFT